MRAGPMRYRIMVQQLADTTALDTYGQVVPNWVNVPSLAPDGMHAAAVKYLFGSTGENSLQVKTEYHQEITMRYFAGLKPGMRLLLDDKTFYIAAINDVDERHREYRIRTQELPPAV